ncbi:Decorin [Oryzias melastigma]|uniref:Decorin n=1 Tax=Oryzias melastigma TaxID=30732 RepID=A0A834CL41_ORYME|nr:Decorin [Oryzias melastigma]
MACRPLITGDVKQLNCEEQELSNRANCKISKMHLFLFASREPLAQYHSITLASLAVFGAQNEASPPPIVWVLRGCSAVGPHLPSFLQSVSGLCPVSPFLLLCAAVSPPLCCERTHLLDFGSQSPITSWAFSATSVSSSQLRWISGVKPHFSSSSENRLPFSSTMRSACLFLLLVTACWALPFRQSGFLDFMMEDDPGSGVFEVPGGREAPVPNPGPKCPFRCQCQHRVIQCSDLEPKRRS